jgi:UDP-glucuronate 4-epimerase
VSEIIPQSQKKPGTALITGGAGFIGSHLADRLLSDGWSVTVADNFEPFYDTRIKWDNVSGNQAHPRYRLVQVDIREHPDALMNHLAGSYDVIVHLAAKAGVRPSLADPVGYQQTNVIGTQNMLELARRLEVKQFVFASSSSVYGVNPDVPWREENAVPRPISPYAATKVAGELLGHTYSYLYGIRFVALRFFTVYGPRQRPDLAIHKMVRQLFENQPLPIYGDGSTRRDYTYIDDILTGVLAAMKYTASSYEIINLGGSHTISLMEMVRCIERAAGIQAQLHFQPEQPGDVPQTYADITKAGSLLGYHPSMDFESGVVRFVDWFQSRSFATRR